MLILALIFSQHQGYYFPNVLAIYFPFRSPLAQSRQRYCMFHYFQARVASNIRLKKYMTAEEINIGFAALLQTFEMVYATQLFLLLP